MSTVSSPRPSIASAQSPTPASSRRPSVESTTFTPRADPPSNTLRRNRVALRDYYNLHPNRTEPSNQSRPRSVPPTPEGPLRPASRISNSELDSPDFDADGYVAHLLATSSLATILRAENSLVSDIKTLDGERKALVYDNYSKLIKAVETIGKMRSILEEEGTPVLMTKTLAPAVGFVADTAMSLIREQEELNQPSDKPTQGNEKQTKTISPEKATVLWALDTPHRLKRLLDSGKRDDAENDWIEIQSLLSIWGEVKGVKELWAKCELLMVNEEQSDT
ncbi:hypothetical protein MGYG_05877 [Nannizzia gypsea CBS 118893]|uniref:Vacuolar protein sorting-associated protein 51 homolog n=1 Tax=Arthroderma gypseum (strain ATCC MYA-4604 / CBS 118893) TaxID=535722 RepID=E4UZT9_ARTGP|nr:hypothetical protein MGYG_05877 [Nannizzia gypsea CBS 118893]EFR02876.1 hypothetical protein MGYG_05877 [Nannizzia gypsea CBS 118893]